MNKTKFVGLRLNQELIDELIVEAGIRTAETKKPVLYTDIIREAIDSRNDKSKQKVKCKLNDYDKETNTTYYSVDGVNYKVKDGIPESHLFWASECIADPDKVIANSYKNWEKLGVAERVENE